MTTWNIHIASSHIFLQFQLSHFEPLASKSWSSQNVDYESSGKVQTKNEAVHAVFSLLQVETMGELWTENPISHGSLGFVGNNLLHM